MGRLFSLLTTRQVFPLSSERQTPAFFGSGGVGVGDAAGLAEGEAPGAGDGEGEADGVGLGLGVAPPPATGCSSPPVPVVAPTSICAYRVFGFDRDTSRPMRPSNPEGNPPPSSFFQLFPASTVFQIPLPGPPPLNPHEVLRRWYEAEYKILLSDASITRSVNPVSSSINLILFQVVPPSVDL